MAIAIPLVTGIAGSWLGGSIGAAIANEVLGAAIGYMAGSMLGSSLFPQSTGPQKLPEVGGTELQGVQPNLPIPILFGTRRLAGCIIYFGELHSYTITHEAEGGKDMGGMMGGGDGVEETRYRRSFMLGLCEGPATVLRVWKGKKEISIDDVTFFDGEDNTGIATLTGKEFASYRHLCCAFFDEYDLGNQKTIPNFQFEVASGSRSSYYGISLATAESPETGVVFDEYGSTIRKHTGYTNIAGCAIAHTSIGSLYFIAAANYVWAYYYGDGSFYKKYPVDIYPNILRIGPEGKYIYIACQWPNDALYKIDIVTGEEIWRTSNGAYGQIKDLIFDEKGRFFLQSIGIPSYLLQLNPLDGSCILAYASTVTGCGCAVLGEFIYAVTREWHVDIGYMYSIHGYHIDSGEQVFWSGVSMSDFYHGMVSCNGYIYTLGRSDGELEKWSAGLAHVGSCSLRTPYWVNNLYVDYNDNLIIMSNLMTDNFDYEANLRFVNTNLNYIKRYTIRGANPGSTYLNDFTNVRQGLGAVSVHDMNPADIMKEVLSNSRCGGGINSALISNDDYSLIKGHCDDNSIEVSILLNIQRPLLDWLDLIQAHYQGFLFLG